MAAQRISTVGFLNEFAKRHELLPDRPFCWILGSGASFQSGIPTGGTLVNQWLRELHQIEDLRNRPIEQWATAENLGIKNFDFEKPANFYPWIYWRRYRKFRDLGYAFLEKTMETAEPGYGYSVLAQIMADTQHKAAITTNFDNLVADALAIYTQALPLICGHESLTGFIRPNLQRPLVAKIHRDLLLNPRNEPEELEKLPEEWVSALTMLFMSYTPIVIGYGGNDGSLMGLLRSLSPIKGGIFWCHRSGEEPDVRIHEIVEHHDGSLVPIHGFDELMLQLREKLKLPDPIPELKRTHRRRVADWKRQFEELNKKINEPTINQVAEDEIKPVREAAAAAVNRLAKEKNWWARQLKADAEPNPVTRERIYREALNDFPRVGALTGNFALFMDEVRENYGEAERLYRRALELEPNNPAIAGNFAMFMDARKKQPDEVERLYRKALKLDPNNATITGNFAGFIKNVRADHDGAELLYRRAFELQPTSAIHASNLADFLNEVRNKPKEAERLYRRAVDLDPDDATYAGNLAVFLNDVRDKPKEAERLYRRAVELDPTDEHWKKQLANFLKEHPRFRTRIKSGRSPGRVVRGKRRSSNSRAATH